MSLLMIGLSHHSAPIAVLERTALDAGGARELARGACRSGAAAEALVLATCNRLEVYADVDSFHPSLAALAELISRATGVPSDELAAHLTFGHGDAAAERLFTVTCGLDSMALGETQVMAQVRSALRRGKEDGTVARVLGSLAQHALRAGKRVHAETAVDRAGRSLLESALADAEAAIGGVAGARALVVGAGALSSLVAATLSRSGAASVTIAGRTPERARRLADSVGGAWVDLTDRPAMTEALAAADLVVSCTGATGHVLDLQLLAGVRARRAAPQLLVDLALPRDIDPAAADLTGVSLVGLAELHERGTTVEGSGVEGSGVAATVAAARAVVAQEVAAYLRVQREAAVAPVVTALRAQARDVMDAELSRLRTRLGALDEAGTDPRVLAEAERTVHRVVEKLLHTPSVRVRALAGSEAGDSYALALAELFDLTERAAVATATGSVAGAADVGVDLRGPAAGALSAAHTAPRSVSGAHS